MRRRVQHIKAHNRIGPEKRCGRNRVKAVVHSSTPVEGGCGLHGQHDRTGEATESSRR